MRLIDADKLYESLMTIETGREYEFCYPCMEVLQVIKKQPTVTLPEPKWIPCSEMLPEDDDYKPFSYYEDGAILFCTKNGKVGFGWYYESTKEWANEDDHTPGEVVAWMPLPEPYKEGEQDDRRHNVTDKR